jgi:hypothetical protein
VYDPHSIIEEKPGPITSDSLAAESTRSGGAFSTNPDSEPQGVAGPKSTFTTTNTSGAIRLDPARDAEARFAQSDGTEEKMLRTGGAHLRVGEAVNPAGTNTHGSNEMGGTTRKAEKAPSYVASYIARQHGYGYPQVPKGSNLKEGGFESDDRTNASFNSDIATENDPSRVAERVFETLNADGDEAYPRQKGVTGDDRYSALENETST